MAATTVRHAQHGCAAYALLLCPVDSACKDAARICPPKKIAEPGMRQQRCQAHDHDHGGPPTARHAR
eukprot:229099-Chlamydomonas_euryale.AAC.4